MLGIVFSLLAATGFGTTAIFARLGLPHIRTTSGTLISLMVSTALTMSIALALHPREIVGLSGAVFLWLALAGALNFPLGRLLNYTGTLLAGVSRASAIVGISPLFAAAFAVLVAGESVNAPIILGTVSIAGGLAMILGKE